MAQSNAVEKQPSMEDILSSIRRIIDDGKAPLETTTVPTVEDAANDITPSAQVAVEVEEKTVEITPEAAQVEETTGSDIPELDSFLESLDAKFQAQQEAPALAPVETLTEIAEEVVVEEAAVEEIVAVAETSGSKEADASVPISDGSINAAETTDFAQREANKYEVRFSENDRNAFAAVGNALSSKTAIAAYEPQLVSDDAKQSVGHSLGQLSETLAQEARAQLPEMTEEMLKPMLSDWLDNNLPSMVERLVRAEIERIARGD